MIISDLGENKFQVRNRVDLSIIKTVEHDFGFLYCGLNYSDKMIVVLGIGSNIIEFNY